LTEIHLRLRQIDKVCGDRVLIDQIGWIKSEDRARLLKRRHILGNRFLKAPRLKEQLAQGAGSQLATAQIENILGLFGAEFLGPSQTAAIDRLGGGEIARLALA
jgi:hypothetical protein